MSYHRLLSLLAILALAAFVFSIGSAPMGTLIQYVPDDAYYYLSAVKQLHAGGGFSIDGIHESTGYQPLWLFLLTLTSADPRGALLIGGALTLYACAVVWMTMKHPAQNAMMILLFLSPGFALNAVSGMETGLMYALLATAWYFVRSKQWVHASWCGYAAVIARPEASLIVLLGFIYYRRSELLRAALLGGATLIAWNLSVSGHILSTSMAMKGYWSGFYDPFLLFKRNVTQSVQLVAGWDLPWWAWTVPATIVAFAVNRWLGAAFLIISIELGRLEWVQTWHVAALTVLVLLMTAGLRRLPLPAAMLYVLTAIFTIVGAVNLVDLTDRPRYPQNVAMYEGAMAVHRGTYGSWNAGMLSYYNTTGAVTNLDGLVNDDVHPYIESMTLDSFLVHNDINLIVDYDSMMTARIMRVRGGYPFGLPFRSRAVLGNTREFGKLRLWERIDNR